MKKIIALILLITTPIGLIISEASKKPLLERVEKEGYSLQSKDSLWEYVKYEVGKGRIDLKANYAKKYQDPILLNVINATVKDSLAIEALIKELKVVFPLKEVVYFSDFVGEGFETYKLRYHKGVSTQFIQSYKDLMNLTMGIIFEKQPVDREIETSRDQSVNVRFEDKILKQMRKSINHLSLFPYSTQLSFDFEEDLPIDKRSGFLVSGFLTRVNKPHLIGNNSETIKFMKRDKVYFKHSRVEETLEEVEGVLKDDKFLLTKMFSKDFKQQFEDYMYKTYPWRYANLFIDKDAAKQNATAIVAFMGLLILILGCSLFWNKKLKRPFLNYFLPFLIFNLSFSSLKELYSYLVQIDQVNNYTIGVVISLMISVLMTLTISFLFWQLEKRIVSGKGSFGYQMIIKLVLTFLFLYLPYMLMIYFSEFLISSGGEITRSLNDLQYLFIVIGLTLGRGLLLYLNHFSESLVKEKDVELSRLKELNAQSELKLLQSHINPHFLYNALNSIAGLAHTNADKTEKMALSLSDLFRYSINKKGEKMSSIEEEVVLVKNYLEIEKIRFGERLQFTFLIDEDLKEVKIPMFMLQPLVENAIKHGISKIGGEGKLTLEIKKDTQGIVIKISDNGPAFPKGLVSGHGLQTVYDLLRLSYGDAASLHWENEPEKFIAISINQAI